MADHYADEEDVKIWLVDAGDSFDDAFEFVGETSTSLPVLLDSDETIYKSYKREEGGESYAPFPLQVIIDRDGTIVYLSNQYDAEAVRAAIDALLAE